MPVIGFGIELGISQPQPDRCDTPSRVYQARQSGGIASRTLPGPVRQNYLAIDIGNHQPSQEVTIARFPVAMLLDAAQSANRFSQHRFDGVVGQAPQETIHRRVVGHARQPLYRTQLAVFTQAYLGFAESPVFVAHQTENREQLRLRELMLVETRAVGRQNSVSHLQGHTSKGQKPDSQASHLLLP
jgi:hypothetical protein